MDRRVAFFSPLPPARSGIADYSRELLLHLGRLADVTLFAPEPTGVDRQLQERFTVCDLGEFHYTRRDFDLALYHMGNSVHHDAIYPYAIRYPGVVVLHDYHLHLFMAQHTLGRQDYGGYLREMLLSGGAAGAAVARAVRRGLQPPPVYEVPLNDRLLRSSLGIIVHSQYAAGQMRKQGIDRPLAVIGALIETPEGQSRRADLDLPQDAVLFGSFGLVTREKKVGLVLRALHRLRQEGMDVHLLVVGDVMADVDVDALVQALDLADAVHHVGFAEQLQDFVDWLHTVDVVVNLRQPTAGETSATALRAMAAGRPVIVSDDGWYAELPDEATLKIAAGEEAALLAAMRAMALSADRRSQMGRAARQYVEQVADPARVAEAYMQFIDETLTRLRYRA